MDKQRDFYMEALTDIGYAVKPSWNLEQVEKLLFKCSTQRKKVLKKIASKIEQKDKDYTDEDLFQIISKIVHIPKNLEKSFIEGVTPKTIQKKLWCSIFQELRHLKFAEPAKQISGKNYFDFLKKLVFEEKFPYDLTVEIFGVQEECKEKESTSVTDELITELNKTIENTNVKMEMSHSDNTLECLTFEKIDNLLKPLANFNERCKERELQYGESIFTVVTSKLENFAESVKTVSDIKSLETEVNVLKDKILSNK